MLLGSISIETTLKYGSPRSVANSLAVFSGALGVLGLGVSATLTMVGFLRKRSKNPI